MILELFITKIGKIYIRKYGEISLFFCVQSDMIKLFCKRVSCVGVVYSFSGSEQCAFGIFLLLLLLMLLCFHLWVTWLNFHGSRIFVL